MKRLVFIVEGDTEVGFVNHCIIPYLYMRGYGNSMNPQKITTNRKLNIKGGNLGFDYLKQEITRIASTKDVLITTMLDFFRLPTDFPNYTLDSKSVVGVETGIREQMEDIVSSSNFLPYIQLHEVESLMFTNMDGFRVVVDDTTQLRRLEDIVNGYPNPEDIDGGSDTAPSKRLERIFPYQKVADGGLILETLRIDDIRAKCPHFNAWIAKLEEGLKNGSF